ncbi:coil containing protein [Vibrio phage 1.049.O._10N.286.54.B5]|nr:coil containing protein [Vibrio phage 1.049.O._10N.286.54.B5]AUR84227.1 hypothetical protein NVP1050O_58 [Vibrio phage 1.050.O._10N.286.48.A6]
MMDLKQKPNLGVAVLHAYFMELRNDDLLYHFDDEVNEIFSLDIFDRELIISNHHYLMRSFGLNKHGRSKLWDVIEKNDCLNDALLLASLDELTDRLQTWCSKNGLSSQCAKELLYTNDISAKQREWLTSFVAIWELTE